MNMTRMGSAAWTAACHRNALVPLIAVFATCLAVPSPARAACGDPPGDVTGNGSVDVIDVQCALLANLWELSDGIAPVPACLGGTDPHIAVDIDCNDEITVPDTTIIVKLALGAVLGAIDANVNGCPDTCDMESSPASCCDAQGFGCGEISCVDCVCGIDPYCCDTLWDDICAEEAQQDCGGTVYFASVSLAGSQEVPPNASAATGIATVWITTDDVLHWHIEHTVAAPTAGHFHMAPAGSNGSVQIPFPSPASPISGSQLLTATQKSAFIAGNIYANIHSGLFPGGEIRGQVMMTELTTPCACADRGDGCSATEAPGASNTDCQTCICALDDYCCYVAWDSACVGEAENECQDDCGCTPPAAFVDCCDEAGGMCPDVDCKECVCAIDAFCCTTGWDAVCAGEAQLECGGGVEMAVLTLTGAQEVPPNASAATGTATVWLTADGILNWVIEHTVASATASHIHMAAAGVAGPVIINLGSPVSPIVGEAQLTSTQLDALHGGMLYFNVHSPTFPGGEVRAQILLNDVGTPCGCALSGDGCSPSSEPGATSETCQACVCALDNFCCTDSWDSLCVDEANDACAADCGCGGAPVQGNCCEITAAFGCTSAVCESCVCSSDLFCCSISWDLACVQEASMGCNGDCGCVPPPPQPTAADCCNDSGSGCGDALCSSCVCGLDAFCCDTMWDGACVDAALVKCGGEVYTAMVMLSGANEVPPNASGHSGMATVWLTANGELHWTLSHTIPSPTAGHIHMAPAGSSGPVVIPFTSIASPITQVAVLTAPQLTAALAGNLYFNLHSALFPGGEIRGQIALQPLGVGCPCADAGNGCTATANAPGATSEPCEQCVCAMDGTCCTAAWDDACVQMAQGMCNSSCMCPLDI